MKTNITLSVCRLDKHQEEDRRTERAPSISRILSCVGRIYSKLGCVVESR